MNYKIILEMGETIMTNKDRLKQAIDKDINYKNNYNEIVKKIDDNKNNVKSSIWKWSLVPICLVLILSSTILLNTNEKTKHFESENKSSEETGVMPELKEEVSSININDITSTDSNSHKGGIKKIDADVRIVKNNGINFPLPYKNGLVSIPNDLDKVSKYIWYFRDDKLHEEYSILGNYEIIYSNDSDRSIDVKYSKDNKPVRDYYFSDEGSKITKINGVEMKIYKFENIYFSEFKYNGYYFDIETSNIKEKELVDFLVSIIK